MRVGEALILFVQEWRRAGRPRPAQVAAEFESDPAKEGGLAGAGFAHDHEFAFRERLLEHDAPLRVLQNGLRLATLLRAFLAHSRGR